MSNRSVNTIIDISKQVLVRKAVINISVSVTIKIRGVNRLLTFH
jgi:hypothetical protein